MMNTCIRLLKIPKICRKAKVIALLKPGKGPNDPKKFLSISLLCRLFKLFERLILNRVENYVDGMLLQSDT